MKIQSITKNIENAYINLRSTKLSKSEKYDKIQSDLKIPSRKRPMIRRAINNYLERMKKETT